VKPVPGTLQDGGALFRSTHWSVIADCELSGEQATEALEQLCRDYWPPLYSFVRRRGYSPADAQDLVQGFFGSFLRHEGYKRTDQSRGKFRTYLLASLKHYLANEHDREQAEKRGGKCEFVLLEEEMEPVEALYASSSELPKLEEEQHYDQSWAAALVSAALSRLSAEFQEEPKRRLFAELKPFLCGGEYLPSQQEIARQLEIPLNTLRSHLSRLRARYAQILRDEVARTIGHADDVEEELFHFRKLLVES